MPSAVHKPKFKSENPFLWRFPRCLSIAPFLSSFLRGRWPFTLLNRFLEFIKVFSVIFSDFPVGFPLMLFSSFSLSTLASFFPVERARLVEEEQEEEEKEEWQDGEEEARQIEKKRIEEGQ